MQLVGISQLPSEVAVSLHWKSSLSRLWNTREASLFKLDLSGWTTCSRDPNLELVAFCYVTCPWRELFIFFCWSFHFLTVLPRIWLWYLYLKINSNPIIWHVSPYRDRNYQERNNKGSSTKQLLTKYLFHFLIHLFIKHFLCSSVPGTVSGTGNAEMNSLLSSWCLQSSGVTDNKARKYVMLDELG